MRRDAALPMLLSMVLLIGGAALLVADSAYEYPDCEGAEEYHATKPYTLVCTDGGNQELLSAESTMDIEVVPDDGNDGPGARSTWRFDGAEEVFVRTMITTPHDQISFEPVSVSSDRDRCEDRDNGLARPEDFSFNLKVSGLQESDSGDDESEAEDEAEAMTFECYNLSLFLGGIQPLECRTGMDVVNDQDISCLLTVTVGD